MTDRDPVPVTTDSSVLTTETDDGGGCWRIMPALAASRGVRDVKHVGSIREGD